MGVCGQGCVARTLRACRCTRLLFQGGTLRWRYGEGGGAGHLTFTIAPAVSKISNRGVSVSVKVSVRGSGSVGDSVSSSVSNSIIINLIIMTIIIIAVDGNDENENADDNDDDDYDGNVANADDK